MEKHVQIAKRKKKIPYPKILHPVEISIKYKGWRVCF